MSITTTPVQAVRVRPLWERHELFRQPQYADGAEWDPEAGVDSNDGDTSGD